MSVPTAEITPEQVRVIRHNAGGVNGPDVPWPFKLSASLKAPNFMDVAFVMLYGPTEELVVRAHTREAAMKFIADCDLDTHPRLLKMTLEGPDGVVEQLYPKPPTDG